MKTILIDNYKIVINLINQCYKFIISINEMIVDLLLFNKDEFSSSFEAEEYAKEYVRYNCDFSYDN